MLLMPTLLFAVLCVAGFGVSVHAAGVPSQQCGWPAVYMGGRFGPPTVRLVQYLLGQALNQSDVIASGVFTENTTHDIEAFQRLENISADGFIGPATWPLLLSKSLVSSGESGFAVLGLQDALNSSGFPTIKTGVFDAQTAVSLSRFQVQRGDDTRSGLSTSLQTWHLLATQCNSTGVFWFDAGWPQGAMNRSVLQCLRDTGGFQFATFECWVEAGPQGQFWEECVQNIANSWDAGYEAVGVYMFPQRYFNATLQARWLLANLTSHNVRYQAIMLDIEGPKWSQYTQAENRAFMLELRGVFDAAGVNVTVYCGDEWPDFFGHGFDSFSDLPIVYAHYDNVPSFYDFYPSYGGWSAASGKQFWDGSAGEVICGSGALDWDWSKKAFWK